MDTQEATRHVAEKVVHTAPTVLQRIQQYWQQFNWDSFGMGTTGRWLPEGKNWLPIGMWFGAGFALGFLTKKYSKAALGVLIVSFLLIAGFEYGGFITINWAAIKQMAGFKPAATLSTLLHSMGTLVRTHLVVCIAGIGGFVFGHHVG